MKTVFLVESIGDNYQNNTLVKDYPITLTNVDAKDRGLNFSWMTETLDLLQSYNHITFEPLKSVMATGLNPDCEYYYFINCQGTVDEFNPNIFLKLSDEEKRFLVKHNISLVIDNSMEITILTSIRRIQHEINRISVELLGMADLNWYFVHAMYYASTVGDYLQGSVLRENIHNIFFPASYFFYARTNILFENPPNRKPYQPDNDYQTKLFENVRNKQITSKDHLWESYCHQPRLNRILFQASAEFNNLTNYGQYSRLKPAKNEFNKIKEIAKLSDYNVEYLTEDFINDLDTIKLVDELNKQHNFPEFFQFRTEPDKYMFRVVTDTHDVFFKRDFDCTNTMPTEKISSAIVLCTPFINLGGHHTGQLLEHYNLKHYKYLEPSTESFLLDQVNDITEKVKRICSMDLVELNKLNDEWKETAIENYLNYFKLDPSLEYIKALHKENTKHIK